VCNTQSVCVDECSATRVFYSFLRGIQLKEIGSFTINAKEKKKKKAKGVYVN
jgi:hypothetical protein